MSTFPSTRPSIRLVAGIVVMLSVRAGSLIADEGWETIFNGKDLSGWKANEFPGSFSVTDGAIRARADVPDSLRKRFHLFFFGGEEEHLEKIRNFELEMSVRGEPGSNSGVFFHTDMEVRDKALHLANGYEVQLNNGPGEKRKTGSLYAVVDLAESPVDESEWFKLRITVNGKRITVRINGEEVIDYSEPENVERPPKRAGRKLNPEGGAIAIQAHDPESTYFFKDIRIRRLP